MISKLSGKTGFSRREVADRSPSHAPDKVEDGLDDTLRDLDLDYLDLYLMHWPVGNTGEDGELEFDYIPVRLLLQLQPAPINNRPC